MGRPGIELCTTVAIDAMAPRGRTHRSVVEKFANAHAWYPPVKHPEGCTFKAAQLAAEAECFSLDTTCCKQASMGESWLSKLGNVAYS